MRRWLLVASITLNLIITCMIGRPLAAQIKTELGLSNGYRVDDLDWNIAGNIAGTNPNILSELTWSDLEIYQVNLGVKSVLNKAFYVRASIGVGWVLDGANQDSDFEGDNRTQEVSRSNNSTDESNVFDATAGFGYQFNLADGKFRLIPLVGFAYSEQNLTITDGFQTISVSGKGFPPTGPIANLDSSYDTKWYGPWLGLDLLFDATDNIMLSAGFEYHWADYEAEAFWNLRTDPIFEHEADATGFMISAGGEYVVTEPWSIGLQVSYQEWSTDPGVDRLFKSDGSLLATRLNKVNWDSLAIMLRITYRFRFFYPP